MTKRITTFGQMLVRKVGGTEELKLTYVDEMVAWEIEKKLRAEGIEIVDKSPGYKLYRDADSAVHDALVFCRR